MQNLRQFENDGIPKLSPRYALEIIFRIGLIGLFIVLESAPPYMRMIHPEEIWRYRDPLLPHDSFLEALGGPLLQFLLEPLTLILYTFLAIFIHWVWIEQQSTEHIEALLVPTLAIPMTGVFVNIIKISVGRPRPTFMERCYGPYYAMKYADLSRPCTGESWLISEGRKSFPSGHTSLACACFTFLFLYCAGKLGTFHENGRLRYTAHLMLLPFVLSPILVGISRISDYKHHWEDVVAGGIIGTLISYLSYRIYFPSLENELSHVPYFLIEPSSNAKHSLKEASVSKLYEHPMLEISSHPEVRNETSCSMQKIRSGNMNADSVDEMNRNRDGY